MKIHLNYGICITVLFFICAGMITPIIALTADFEIPLSEFDKVKMKRPSQPDSKKRRSNTKKQVKPASVNTENTSDQQRTVPTPPESAATPAKQEKEPASAAPGEYPIARFNHTPYSYVVAGRRITIQAVISSEKPLTKALCYFHATGSTQGAAITMGKISGTRFTYSATIPALAPESKGLSYRMYAVDSDGATIQSQEYSIPLSVTPITPGWQQESSDSSLQVQLDENKSALEGFSDAAVQAPHSK